VWELPTGHRICSYAWPDAADGERPETVAFAADDAELQIAFANRISFFDVKTGDLLRSHSFAGSSQYTLLNLNSADGTLYACYQEQYPSEEGYSLYLADALTGRLYFQVQMAPADVPFVSSGGRNAIIWRQELGRAEVWDLRAGRCLHTMPLPGLYYGLSFGPEDRFLAQAYDPRASGTPRKGCVLEIWDIVDRKLLQQFNNTISWDLEWSTQSGLMAMSNHFEDAQPPDRNLTV